MCILHYKYSASIKKDIVFFRQWILWFPNQYSTVVGNGWLLMFDYKKIKEKFIMPSFSYRIRVFLQGVRKKSIESNHIYE